MKENKALLNDKFTEHDFFTWVTSNSHAIGKLRVMMNEIRVEVRILQLAIETNALWVV